LLYNSIFYLQVFWEQNRVDLYNRHSSSKQRRKLSTTNMIGVKSFIAGEASWKHCEMYRGREGHSKMKL
jgi:hypothetical protein